MQKRIMLIAGLLLAAINLAAIYGIGFDLARSGVLSTQPLFQPGQPWQSVPLLVCVLGLVAGCGWVARRRWVRGVTAVYVLLLAFSAPVWAQQMVLGFGVYTSHPPALWAIAVWCALTTLLAVVVLYALVRLVPPAALSPSPRPWYLPACVLGVAAGHFLLTLLVQHLLGSQSMSTQGTPMPLGPLLSLAFPLTQLAPTLLSPENRPVAILVTQSLIFSTLTVYLTAGFARIPPLARLLEDLPWSRWLVWPGLAGIAFTLSVALPVGLLLVKLSHPPVTVLSSRDFYTSFRRVDVINRYYPCPTPIRDAVFQMQQTPQPGGRMGYCYIMALKVDPLQMAVWRRNRSTGHGTQPQSAFYAQLFGRSWVPPSTPEVVHLNDGEALVFAQEGIVLVTVSGLE